MRARPAILIALALVLGAAQPGAAEKPNPDPGAKAADPARAAMQALSRSIQKAELDNGLRVVMNVDRASPTVAVCVTYDVGSRNEERGKSGFAHLFEHMMFQGSKNVPKGAHFKLISARGGTLNGTTSPDRTNFYEILPASELALGLWLEADRMRWLAVDESNFENQRRVVQEEYRMRVANAAYMRGMMRIRELTFDGYWPYEHPTIGSMNDLENAKIEWVQAFYDRYYAPNNAVVALAGDFDPDQAMQLVRRYFGEAKPSRDLPRYEPPPTPKQTKPRHDRQVDKNAKLPGLYNAWMIPPANDEEHYAIDLLAIILTDGESSVLHESLVRNSGIARSVSMWTADQRGPDMLTLMALVSGKGSIARVQRAIDAEIDKLRRRGPSKAQLEKAKNRLRSKFIFGLESNLTRAAKLAEYELFYGDARLLTRELDHYLAVTPEDVKKVLAKYVVDERRSVVEVVPEEAKGAGQ